MVGSLSSQIANAASGPSDFRRFAMCSERALMLRLKVDATLAVPVLSKMMCSRPCVGAANDGFFGVKEQNGSRSPPRSLVSFWPLPVGKLPFYHSWMSNQRVQIDGWVIDNKMLGLKQSHWHC